MPANYDKNNHKKARKSVVEIVYHVFLVAGLYSDNSVLRPDQQEEIEEAALALLRIFQNLKPFLRYLLSNDVASKVRSGIKLELKS